MNGRVSIQLFFTASLYFKPDLSHFKFVQMWHVTYNATENMPEDVYYAHC